MESEAPELLYLQVALLPAVWLAVFLSVFHLGEDPLSSP